MKYRRCAVITVWVMALLLSACGASGTTQGKTIKAQDSRVSIEVPAEWSEHEAEPKDNLVLAVQNGAGAFAQVFWYPAVKDKDWKAKDYKNIAADYYGDGVVGSPASIKLGDNAGYYFAYSMDGTDKDGSDYTYQGYEYFIAFKDGVVEVDIFYRYTDTAPTNDQLAALRTIAETVQAKA